MLTPNAHAHHHQRLNASNRRRRTFFTKLAQLGHFLVDHMLADALEDGPPEYSEDPADLGLDGIAMGRAVRAPGPFGAEVSPADLGNITPFQRTAQQEQRYPLPLGIPMTGIPIDIRRGLRIVDGEGENAGKRIILDIPATPDVIAALEGPAVPPGGTIELTGIPQVAMRPCEILIEEELLPAFTVVDFRVGKNSQLASSGEVHAAHFSGKTLRCDALQVSMTATLRLHNITDKTQRAPQVTVYGTAID